MAYISTQEVANIRKSLKAAFPEIKFSVRKGAGSYSVNVSVMKSPYFDDGVKGQVNHYYINEHFEGKQRKVLNSVDEIIRKAGEWYDNSDAMVDYFDTAFYYHIEIGQWDKPHQKVKK